MFRATGPGKREDKCSFPGIIHALLYNFDFDDMQGSLKAEHQKFLREKVVPILKNDNGQIWMQGSASRIGAYDYNKKLSDIRVHRVADFLTANSNVTSKRMQTDAIGSD